MMNLYLSAAEYDYHTLLKVAAVSYTHLDVYKRQEYENTKRE